MSRSNPASEYYVSMANAPTLAMEWADMVQYIMWNSTVPENAHFGSLNVFTVCLGNRNNPSILFIHDSPTSSYDFRELFEELSQNYYVCALDDQGTASRISLETDINIQYTMTHDWWIISFEKC